MAISKPMNGSRRRCLEAAVPILNNQIEVIENFQISTLVEGWEQLLSRWVILGGGSLGSIGDRGAAIIRRSHKVLLLVKMEQS